MELKTGHYYRWTGPKERPDGWNSSGEMDFMLDGQPHLCTEGSGYHGAFEDSPDPSWSWKWNGSLEFLVDCGEDDKSAAIKRLDAIEREAKELRKIIDKKSMKYDSTKLYVGVKDGCPYIMVGRDEEEYFRFHCLSGYHQSELGWDYALPTGKECLNKHLEDGFVIHEFDDTADALKFFLKNL